MKTSVLGPQRVLLFCVAIALILAQLAPASAQTNEGTLSGTLAAFGTVNATGSGCCERFAKPVQLGGRLVDDPYECIAGGAISHPYRTGNEISAQFGRVILTRS